MVLVVTAGTDRCCRRNVGCSLDVVYVGVVYFRNNGQYHSKAYSLNDVKNIDNC